MSAVTPYSAEADALVRELRALSFPVTEAERQVLIERVDAFVDQQLIADAPLEGVIVAVKGLARSAGLGAARHLVLLNQRATAEDELICELVAWCVARYYDFEH